MRHQSNGDHPRQQPSTEDATRLQHDFTWALEGDVVLAAEQVITARIGDHDGLVLAGT